MLRRAHSVSLGTAISRHRNTDTVPSPLPVVSRYWDKNTVPEAAPAESSHSTCAVSTAHPDGACSIATAGSNGSHSRALGVLPDGWECRDDQADAPPGHHLRAPSVAYLRDVLLSEVHAVGLPSTAKVFQIEPQVIRPKGASTPCPRDGRLGAAYVDCIPQKHAGMATVMLSYGWAYEVAAIVETLVDFCQNSGADETDTLVWICCLCINQHRVQEAKAQGLSVPFEDFQHQFESRVTSIGHLIAMMAPWSCPLYCTRVWCVLELFTGVSNGCIVTVGMPPAEAKAMQAAILEGRIQKLWDAFGSIKVANAQASVEGDRVRILDLVEHSVGFSKFDACVTAFLRDWVLATCQNYLQELMLRRDSTTGSDGTFVSQIAAACLSLGLLLLEFGRPAQAVDVLNKGLRTCEAADSLVTPLGANLLTRIGIAQLVLGNQTVALDIFKQAQSIRISTGTLGNCKEGARVMMCIGWAKSSLGDLNGSLDDYEEAKQIHIKAGTLETSSGASVLKGIGISLLELGDASSALIQFEESKRLHLLSGALETPEGAAMLMQFGRAKAALGFVYGALEQYQEAKRVRMVTGTLQTPGGAVLLMQIAEAKEQLGDLIGAQQQREEAKQVQISTGTFKVPASAIWR